MHDCLWMNFDNDEDWDLDLIDDLVRKEEEAIAAKRATQTVPSTSSLQPLLRVTHPSVSSLKRAATEEVPTVKKIQGDHIKKAQSAFTGATDYIGFVSNWKSSSTIDHEKQLSVGESRAGDANAAQAQNYVKVPSSGNHGIKNQSYGRTPNGCNINISSKETTGPEVPQYLSDPKHRFDNQSVISGQAQSRLVAPTNNSTFQNVNAGKFSLSGDATDVQHSRDQSMADDVSRTVQPGKTVAPLIDKENMICELRSRLSQADQELSQFRKNSLLSMSAPSSLEQKEIERLRAQILFKDQEILESRRVCTEKAEKLKEALYEVDCLKKEAEELQGIRQSKASADMKLREERKRDNVQSPAVLDSDGRRGLRSQDLWLPPWKLSGAPEVLESASNAKNFNASGALPLQNAALDTEDLFIVAELKSRTVDNGCTSITQKEGNPGSSILQDQEFLPKTSSFVKDSYRKGERNTSFNLLKIWSSGGIKEDSLELMSKLFTICQADMKVLLSISSEKADYNKHACDIDENCKEVDQGISEPLDLHAILAKMSNGLTRTGTLFMAVLEICRSEKIQVVESALRVLHCILVHDRNCRDELFERSSFQPPKKPQGCNLTSISHVSAVSHIQDLNDAQMNLRGIEGQSAAAPMESVKSYFSSPRIYYRFQGSDIRCMEELNTSHNRKDCKKETLLMRLFRRFFSLALQGMSQAVKIEALSILNVLIVDTEPMNERERFGAILFDGSIGILMRKSESIDVRLQAVRLLQFVLHCPSALQKLCSIKEKMADAFAMVSGQGLEGDDSTHSRENDAETTEGETSLAACKPNVSQLEAANALSKSELKNIEVIEELIACLFYLGGSFQEYALRRSALRALTFIATSGHRGAATVLAAEVTFCKEGSLKDGGGKGLKDQELPLVIIGSLPFHLIFLLDNELKAEEEDDSSPVRTVEGEERECLIREALTLLCRLASHPTQSSTTLAAVTVDKSMMRLSICVTNRLISRVSWCKTSEPEGKYAVSPADIIELAKGLRRRILAGVSNL